MGFVGGRKMLITAFFCFGIAVCIVAGLICYSLAKTVKKGENESNEGAMPPADANAAWMHLRAAMRDMCSQREYKETPLQKGLRSWAGTLVICAGLCTIGMVLELEYRQSISMDQVMSGLVGSQRVTVPIAKGHSQEPANGQSTNGQPSQQMNR
jgi:hypothetical protein